jgi:DNA-binding response OmpR family regulator
MARILVIDDTANIRTLVEKFLVLDGHDVDTAENGAVGLKLARLHQYDLVITDVVMPEQDGLEVVMELKRSSPLVKIIVITGGGGTFDIPDLLKMTKMLKADRGLAKPLDYIKLQAVVREVLEQAQ